MSPRGHDVSASCVFLALLTDKTKFRKLPAIASLALPKTHFSGKRTGAFCSAPFKATKDIPSCITHDVTHPVRDAMAFCS